MAPTHAVELPTEDFGRWVQRARVVLPVPLTSGYAARVDLDWDELLTVSEDRLEIIGALERADRDQPPQVREMLRYAARLLGEPDVAVFAVRSDLTTGRETSAIGLAAGPDGLLVVDTPATVRLVRMDATELAGAVIAAMPAVRGFAIDRVEVPERALATLRAGATPRGLDRAATNAAAAAGIPAAVVESLARLQEATTGGGVIGAVRYDDDGPRPGPVGSDWFEGPTGAVLKRTVQDGGLVYEPATRTSMTSAAVAAVSAVAHSAVSR